MSLTDKVVVDLGCKYGHILPLLIGMGASEAIGIEAEASYLAAGKAVFEFLYPKVKLLQSERGYLPLQPESVDLILVNEVISHINPAFLETVYAEMARILKPNGRILISDGNNAANAQCRAKLPALYQAWENGPDGSRTDRDVVVESYFSMRRRIIRARHPNLAMEQVENLVLNTSGLFGDYFVKVVDDYVNSGELIRRPYRHGICPTNPNVSGVVMEKAFHPVQIEIALANYGLVAHQIFPKRTNAGRGIMGRFLAVQARMRDWWRDVREPGWRRGESEGFQIIGVKT